MTKIISLIKYLPLILVVNLLLIEVASAVRGNVAVSSTVSRTLSLPSPIQGKCLDPDPLDSDFECPQEDMSDTHQAEGQGEVNIPQPNGNGFTFSGLCSFVGPAANNICREVVDCLENSGTCAINDCLRNPSQEECRQLCTSDPTNTACAAFDCAEDPGENCCAVVKIPECCDFFEILDQYQSCRANPSAECCELITSFGGDDVFRDRCENLERCFSRKDRTCCELFPDNSRECVEILGCVGISTDSTEEQLQYCCRFIPDDRACDAYDCYRRIEAGRGFGCCEFIDDNVEGSPCAAFFNCKQTLSAGLQSPAARSCCESFVDLQACQTLECINIAQQDLEEGSIDGVLFSGGGSLEYCCSLTPQSETCQKFIACFTDPVDECCTLFESNVPACAFQECYENFFGDNSTAGEFPPFDCCQALPGIPKCRLALECFYTRTSECCNLLGGNAPPTCLLVAGCIVAITDPSTPFSQKAECCRFLPGESNNQVREYCDAFFMCESEPSVECCAAGSDFHDSDVCEQFLECLANPDYECCVRYRNAASTPECQIIIECVQDPTVECCLLPQLSGVPICAQLIQCSRGFTLECCRQFPEVSDICESAAECYNDLVQSNNANNSCCNAVLAAGVDFPLCEDLLDCIDSLLAGEATVACCNLLPGDDAPWQEICRALLDEGDVIDFDGCDNPDIFGGCHCAPNSPGGRNNHETIFF